MPTRRYSEEQIVLALTRAKLDTQISKNGI